MSTRLRRPCRTTIITRIVLLMSILAIPGPAAVAQIATPNQAQVAAGCPSVAPTPTFTIAYGEVQFDGQNAPVGTIVEAVSPRGNVAGCFEVTAAGHYGAMFVYGEDTTVSPAIPGMRNGETVTFRVDGVAATASPQLAWSADLQPHQVGVTARTQTCYTLNTGVDPAGSGTVGQSPPPNCGGNQYTAGTQVQLTAQAATGYGFDHWSGHLAGTASPQSITISSDRTVTAHFVQTSAGPLVYAGQTVDDDQQYDSNGNGDGIAQCGETLELLVDLTNQGSVPLTGVTATAATNDPYATWLFGTTNAFPDIGPGGRATSTGDFDLRIDASTPDGHAVVFDLQMTASNGGPWTDTFSLNVSCQSGGGTVAVPVSQSTDDAEQRLTDGNVALKGVDLELGVDSVSQLVGLRFQNVQVPRGANITNASIVVTADETHSGATNLTFRGQNSDNAPTFSSGNSNLSNRPQTSASVPWNNVPPWSTVHATYQSPNLATIIQEIINRPGWSSGNSLVILVQGSGRRTAESFNGEPSMAPRLLIDYGSAQPPACYTLSRTHTGSGSDPVPSPANSTGCPTGQFVAGQIINLTASPASGWTIASWSGTNNNASTATTNQLTMPAASHTVSVNYVQQQVSCYTLSLSHSGSGGDPIPSPANSTGCPTSQFVAGQLINLTASPASGWTVASWSGTNNNASTATTNQLTMPAASRTVTVNYVQQQVSCYTLSLSHSGSGGDPVPSPANSAGCPAGQFVAGQAISLTASPASGWTVASWSGTTNNNSTATTNQLTMPASSHAAAVNYVQGPAPGYSLDVAVSQDQDDAEERATGSLSLKSNDLELVQDRDTQTVGLRFQNITLPKGSLVSEAYIIFHANSTHNGVTNLTFRAQTAGNPAAFEDVSGNITSRPTTAAAVNWNNVPAWTVVHDPYVTPNLAPIIQEVVDRSDWSSGNALVLIVTGSGRREAESYDGADSHGDTSLAPALHITYAGP